MIADRTNPRTHVFLWLCQIRRVAEGEKAEYTADKVRELSEPILAMTASSEAADPKSMSALVERPDFPKKAAAYLAKNWFLNIGIPDSVAATEAFEERCRNGAEAALAALRAQPGSVTEMTGKAVSDRIEALADDQFRTGVGFAAGQGHGTPVLLREALGLPGDHAACVAETRSEVLMNAARALTALGVRVEPEALVALGKRQENPFLDEVLAFHARASQDHAQNALIDMNPEPEVSEAAADEHFEITRFVQTVRRRLGRLDAGAEVAAFHAERIASLKGVSPDLPREHLARIHAHEDGILCVQRLCPEADPHRVAEPEVEVIDIRP